MKYLENRTIIRYILSIIIRFWGWGAEDDDMRARLITRGLKPKYLSGKIGRFKVLDVYLYMKSYNISANLLFFCLNLNHIFFSHFNIRTIQFPVSSSWKSIGRLTQEQSMKMDSSKQNTNILIQSKLNCLQKLQLIYYMKSN